MEDVNLRLEFHRALDAVAPPAPWLAQHVREDLRRRSHQARVVQRRREWFARPLPQISMRFTAIVLMLALALAAASIFLAINNFVHRPVPLRTNPGRVSRMCVQGGVYTVNKKSAILHKFLPVPVVNGEGKGRSQICDLDGTYVWVAVGIGSLPNQPGQPDHFIVLSTGDGGQTWKQSAPIPAGTGLSSGNNFTRPVRLLGVTQATLDFLDSEHGWLLLDIESAQTSGRGHPIKIGFTRRLFATSDGGLSWHLVTTASGAGGGGLGQTAIGCIESGMTFIDVTTGWVTWDCNGGIGPNSPSGGSVIVGTSDGGRTWKQVVLPSYTAGADWFCGSTPPIFTGGHGVLEIGCGSVHGGSSAVYSTVDGGRTWTESQLPFFFTLSAHPDFVDGYSGFFLQPDSPINKAGGSDLYRTTDSGRTWTIVKKGLFPGQSLDKYQFIDANIGFACTLGSTAPWWTYDGGKTWSPPAPDRSIGDTVCPTYPPIL